MVGSVESGVEIGREASAKSRPSLRPVGWFLAVSYGIGAPLIAILQYSNSVLSARFDLPPWLIYLTAAIQLSCVPLILSRRYVRSAAFALSATTVGAAISHIRIGSPPTALPAVVYTAVQLWFGVRVGADHTEPWA
jgi:hypothetical protein